MEFISAFSSDVVTIVEPLLKLGLWLEPIGKVAAAVAKLIGLMPK